MIVVEKRNTFLKIHPGNKIFSTLNQIEIFMIADRKKVNFDPE